MSCFPSKRQRRRRKEGEGATEEARMVAGLAQVDDFTSKDEEPEIEEEEDTVPVVKVAPEAYELNETMEVGKGNLRLEYLENELKGARVLRDNQRRSVLYSKLGETYLALNRLEDALDSYNLALSYAGKGTLTRAYIGMGETYLRMGQVKAKEKGEAKHRSTDCFMRALDYCATATRLAEREDRALYEQARESLKRAQFEIA